MASTASFSPSQYSALTGPILIGGFLHWGLFGAFLIQLYNYFHGSRSSRDPLFIKFFVWVTVVLELVLLFIITHTIWYNLVVDFGDPNVAEDTGWSSSFIPFLTGSVTMVVQIFFAWRIPTLERHIIVKVIAALTVALSLLQWATTLAFSILYFQSQDDYSKIHGFNDIAEIWLVSAAVGDWVIGVTMVILLQRSRTMVYFPPAKRLISKLTRNVIESGLITATLAVADLVLFKALPTSASHLAVEFTIGSLYANILLANLNGRDYYDLAHNDFLNMQEITLGPLTPVENSLSESRTVTSNGVEIKHVKGSSDDRCSSIPATPV